MQLVRAAAYASDSGESLHCFLVGVNKSYVIATAVIVQELCESRGGRPGLSILMSLTVSVDVKQH